jgi:hypothetical protein
MNLTVDEMIEAFQSIAARFDIGDITSEPRSERVSLSKDEIIDLMIDAYNLGHRHGRQENSNG